jgi:hypothetical protein
LIAASGPEWIAFRSLKQESISGSSKPPPDSERWRTLFAAGPGEHWLVRSQWHLCKLTDDPASKDDDAGLRAALRDGHGDESLPGYAARLSEVLGIEG